MTAPKALAVPTAVATDERAIQLLSVWSSDAVLHCTTNIGPASSDAQAWGELLAQAVRQAAVDLQEQTGADAGDAMVDMIEALLNALNGPGSNDDD